MRDADIRFEPARPIDPDARLVMEWRNDPATLAQFFHQTPKAWESFRREFRDDYFRHAHLPPLFAVLYGDRVAFLRFLPYGGRRAACDVSINVAPGRRGQGIGAAVLRAVQGVLRSSGIDEIVAEIRPDNVASRSAFEAAGFAFWDATQKRVADLDEPIDIVRYRRSLREPSMSQRVFIIAEAGSNWRCGTTARDMSMAKTLIDVAAEAGADAVKFQTYRAETVYVPNAGDSEYLAEAGIRESITDIFRDLAMPYEMIPELAAHAAKQGLEFMSTPFSVADFDAIDPFVARHKIASYEISHPRLLQRAGRSGKPLVLSTGASDEADIAWAMETFLAAGGRDLTLLQCTAKYPAPLDAMNLRAIGRLARRFGVPVGLSDHSRHPTWAPLAAVALGATVIEKHYTLDNRLPGPDHAFAVTPGELAELVRAVRAAQAMLGSGEKHVLAAEGELRAFAQRAIQATRDIRAGETLAEGVNIDVLRPGKRARGLHPRRLGEIEGRRAARDIALGDGIREGDWTP